jgi:hypothetical protein
MSSLPREEAVTTIAANSRGALMKSNGPRRASARRVTCLDPCVGEHHEIDG